uniref:Uncharacterized protein n=1 Tax=Anguilla anguilla TaxID=7936 RepID=A0A0E9QR70_ANGAN
MSLGYIALFTVLRTKYHYQNR